jgi:hypothetical protein
MVERGAYRGGLAQSLTPLHHYVLFSGSPNVNTQNNKSNNLTLCIYVRGQSQTGAFLHTNQLVDFPPISPLITGRHRGPPPVTATEEALLMAASAKKVAQGGHDLEEWRLSPLRARGVA